MNFSAMTKEQKQYVFLGTLVGGIATYSLFTFVLAPMKEKWQESRSKIEELADQLEDAERLVRTRPRLEANLSESKEKMESAFQGFLPEIANPLSWATLTIYAQARKVGVDIRSVSEIGAPAILVMQGKDEDRLFGAYSVRIETECSFKVLKELLRAIEISNPYVCVSALSIAGKRDDPEIHTVNISVEWPAWIDADMADRYGPQKGKQHG